MLVFRREPLDEQPLPDAGVSNPGILSAATTHATTSVEQRDTRVPGAGFLHLVRLRSGLVMLVRSLLRRDKGD